MNYVFLAVCALAAFAFGYTVGFERGLRLCKPLWIEIKTHRGKLKTKWPKAVDANKEIES